MADDLVIKRIRNFHKFSLYFAPIFKIFFGFGCASKLKQINFHKIMTKIMKACTPLSIIIDTQYCSKFKIILKSGSMYAWYGGGGMWNLISGSIRKVTEVIKANISRKKMTSMLISLLTRVSFSRATIQSTELDSG